MATAPNDQAAPSTTIFSQVEKTAKAAYVKSASSLGELGGYAKEQVGAAVESSKILGNGLRDLGTGYATGGRAAVQTMRGDIKDFAAVRSPADLFQVQSKILRRNFSTAVDFGLKNTEAMIKLAKDASAPLAKRVTVAD